MSTSNRKRKGSVTQQFFCHHSDSGAPNPRVAENRATSRRQQTRRQQVLFPRRKKVVAMARNQAFATDVHVGDEHAGDGKETTNACAASGSQQSPHRDANSSKPGWDGPRPPCLGSSPPVLLTAFTVELPLTLCRKELWALLKISSLSECFFERCCIESRQLGGLILFGPGTPPGIVMRSVGAALV